MFKGAPEHGIAPIAGDQIPMFAHFGNAVVINDNDTVGAGRGTEAMGDN
jgi:hypothetical protein